MTRIDFYVVSGAGVDERLSVAARLADKAWHQGHSLFVNAADETQARVFDELLWQFRPGSFVPHALVTENPREQVVVGWGQAPDDLRSVLINLDTVAPPFFARFERVAEVVTQDEAHLQALREAWRFYKDRGYPLHKHDL